MADEIRADYDTLERLAGQFASQSQAIQQVLRQVKGRVSSLERGGWIGEGAKSFYAEMNDEVLPASQRLQQALEEASRVTRDISQTIQQAEDEASSPFRAS